MIALKTDFTQLFQQFTIIYIYVYYTVLFFFCITVFFAYCPCQCGSATKYSRKGAIINDLSERGGELRGCCLSVRSVMDDVQKVIFMLQRLNSSVRFDI